MRICSLKFEIRTPGANAGWNSGNVTQLASRWVSYHLMAMTSDDIYSPGPLALATPVQRGAGARARRSIRKGVKFPTRQFNPQFDGFRFDFGNGTANPFGNLTREQRLARIEAIAKLLDVAFVVPGTNIRYGIDGLIGLVPVVGDLITTAISLWLVREARALGAPWHITARMLANVALDGAVGIVPIAGDAFDVMFRANVRNVRMLKRWMEKQPR